MVEFHYSKMTEFTVATRKLLSSLKLLSNIAKWLSTTERMIRIFNLDMVPSPFISLVGFDGIVWRSLITFSSPMFLTALIIPKFVLFGKIIIPSHALDGLSRRFPG